MSDVAPAGANMQTSLLELFCEALDAAVFFTDKSDCLIFASRRFSKSYSVAEINLQPGTRVRQFFANLYDGGMHSGSFGDAGRMALSKEDWVAERIALIWRERHEVIEQIGRARWIKIVTRRLPTGMGMTAVIDISDAQKRERQWRSDSERVKLTEEILDNLPVPVFVQDANLNFAAVNKAFCKLQSTTPDNLLGRSIWDLFAPELAGEFDETSRRHLTTEKSSDLLLQMRRPDGKELHMVANAQRIGRPGQYFIANCFTDVTSHLGAAGQGVRRDGLPPQGGINLEDPTPPTVIDRTAEVKESAPRNAAANRLNIAVLTQDGERGAIMTGILKAAGHDCCVMNSVRELEAFLPAVQSAGLALNHLFIDSLEGGTTCETNIGPLESALAQHGVLTHDIPLDSDGDIDFAATTGFFDDRSGEISETMADHRAAVAENAEPPKASAAVDADLAPEQSIARLPSPSARPRPDAPTNPVPVMDVLVVEDNKINRHVFVQVLESLGIEHKIVETAAEALVAWRTRRPAMMMVDLTLPDMDGCDLVRFIRREENAGHAATPIIGVLARDGVDERKRCSNAGMDDTIIKPLSPDLIDALFRKHALGEDNKMSIAV